MAAFPNFSLWYIIVWSTKSIFSFSVYSSCLTNNRLGPLFWYFHYVYHYHYNWFKFYSEITSESVFYGSLIPRSPQPRKQLIPFHVTIKYVGCSAGFAMLFPSTTFILSLLCLLTTPFVCVYYLWAHLHIHCLIFFIVVDWLCQFAYKVERNFGGWLCGPYSGWWCLRLKYKFLNFKHIHILRNIWNSGLI